MKERSTYVTRTMTNVCLRETHPLPADDASRRGSLNRVGYAQLRLPDASPSNKRCNQHKMSRVTFFSDSIFSD